jgi:hypothetical protein
MITKEELHQIFLYKAGKLYYRQSVSPTTAKGQPAGTPCGDAVKILIKGKSYREHNLVWIYHKGDIPDGYKVRWRSGHDNYINNLILKPIRSNK